MTLFNSFMISILLIGIIGIMFLLGRTPIKLGQVINDAFLCQNGVCTWSYRLEMRGSTSTPCSVRSPDATSTIIHASMNLLIQATSTLGIGIGWGNNTNATTTSLASTTLAANVKGNMVATSTLQGFYATSSIPLIITNHIIGPNQYVNFYFDRIAGISKGSVGSCEIIFRVL